MIHAPRPGRTLGRTSAPDAFGAGRGPARLEVHAMSADEAEAVARDFIQRHNGPEYAAALDEILAPDCVVHEYLPGLPDGINRDGYKQFVGTLREAMPDICTHAEELVVQGDAVAIRWTGSGTHTGADLFGIP